MVLIDVIFKLIGRVMDCYSEIIGFHANHYIKCDRFLEGLFDQAEDTQWLGKGMYFWDNLSNAKFWKKQKIRKGPCRHPEAYKIVKAKISCKDIFDFTNDDERTTFGNLLTFATLGLSIKEKSKIERMGFGQKIDYVFSYYSDLESCSVVKVHADYSENENNFELFGKSNLVSTIKTIYSVRKDSVISCREVCKDE
jgi:hypothetical protein